jgi:hypothetical protein
VDQPNAATILGAAKLSGRSESGWSVGFMNATTQRESARTADEFGQAGAPVPVEPLANYGVLRVAKDFRDGTTQVGFMGTAVHRNLDDPAFDFLRDRAYAGGLDFSHRFARNAYNVRAHVGGSYIHGSPEAMMLAQQSSARYYQRPDQDYLSVDPTATTLGGATGNFALEKKGGHWLGGIGASFVTPGFEINDAGFHTQSDNIMVGAGFARSWPEPTKLFRQTAIHARMFNRWNFGGTLFQQEVKVDWSGVLHNQRGFSVRTGWIPELSDPWQTRGGPLFRQPGKWLVGGSFRGDRRNTISAGISGSYRWNAEGSWGVTMSPSLNGRGQGRATWSLQPRYSQSRDDAFYVTQLADPTASATYGSRYVFAGLEQKSLDLTVRLDLAMTPSVSLQLYAQPFIATGDYEGFRGYAQPNTYTFDTFGEGASTIGFDQDTNTYTVDPDGAAGGGEPIAFFNPDFRVLSLRGNAVLRWEYVPGSTLFFVWSQDRSGFSSDPDFGGFGSFGDVFREPQRNVFMIKVSYWLDF